jgi:YebC/PmpR family DNA-binding regulatory protein
MAGHSQFKNIMHRKGAQDAKRAKLFTKLIREIITAVRAGQPDPAFNPRLRNAIIDARSSGMPKDKIESAISRGSSTHEGENYEEMRYEGYAPGGVAIVVEALTDNRNRTASEVRSAFTKHGGAMGETGSVSFLFDHVGLIRYGKAISSYDAMFEATIEAGAEDCVEDEEGYNIYCAIDQFQAVRDFLAERFGDPEIAKRVWQAKTMMEASGEDEEKLAKLIATLEDSDDVQEVYANF